MRLFKRSDKKMSKLVDDWLKSIGVGSVEGVNLSLSEISGTIEITPDEIRDLVNKVRIKTIRECLK